MSSDNASGATAVVCNDVDPLAAQAVAGAFADYMDSSQDEVYESRVTGRPARLVQGSKEEEGGTARGLNPELTINNDVGAKTGTTQNASDGWFIGVTKNLVSGAWVGGDDRSIHFRNWVLGQGARTAMPIWQEFMLKTYNDSDLKIQKRQFDKPTKSKNIET